MGILSKNKHRDNAEVVEPAAPVEAPKPETPTAAVTRITAEIAGLQADKSGLVSQRTDFEARLAEETDSTEIDRLFEAVGECEKAGKIIDLKIARLQREIEAAKQQEEADDIERRRAEVEHLAALIDTRGIVREECRTQLYQVEREIDILLADVRQHQDIIIRYERRHANATTKAALEAVR